MALVEAQTFNASNVTFNQVQGNQHNNTYHAQQINFGTPQDLERTVQAVVRWLHSLPFDSKHRYVSSKLRQTGTGLWLLEDQRVKTWVSAKGSFLWLHGIPGSGKTVLTSTVIDDVLTLKCTLDHGFAYFYADFSEAKTREPKHILRSLLAQLLSSKPELIQSQFGAMVKQMNDNHDPPSDVADLVDLIMKACNQFADATLVLDACDECVARDEFLPCFETLRNNGNIRILVTSRKEKDIHDAFRDYVTIALENEGKSVLHDMESHILQELAKGRGLTKIPQKMKDVIIKSLLERADGMFRWVQCQLDQIRSIRTNNKILEALQNLPKGLFATYDRILQSIAEDDIHFAHKTISWLLVSEKPLRVTEIVEALAVDVESRRLDRDATLNDGQDLLEICSSLVAYNDDTDVLSFSHYSVQEYFLSAHLRSDPLTNFAINLYESHRDLSRICLTYLLLDCFTTAKCDTESERAAQAREYPFLKYAANDWDVHAEQCPGADDVFQLSMNLLSNDAFKQNYVTFVRTRHPTLTSLYLTKFPLSYLVNGRLTWMLRRISTSPPNWYNDDLGEHGTPLAGAVWRNDVEMIKFLLDAGADVNKPTNNHIYIAGMTPLSLAATLGCQEAFDTLLARGADPSKPHTFTHCTVLHEFCGRGQVRRVKQLLELGLDVNAKNLQGLTPIHFAVQGRSLEVVKLLVEAGAQILGETRSSATRGFGKTAIHYAVELQSEPITEYLLERCGDLEQLENLTLEQIRWAEGKPWYSRLRQAVSSRNREANRVLTPDDVMRAKCLLQERLMLPPTVSAIVLDYAEYWVRSVGWRNEAVVVDENTADQPYVKVRVPGWGGSSPVRRVVFRTRSHDQGFSDYPEHHLTYRASASWFEVKIAPQRTGLEPIRFQDNVHASPLSREHINEWDVRYTQTGLREWIGRLQCGDIVEVYARAMFPGWKNYVEFVEVELYCAWFPDE